MSEHPHCARTLAERLVRLHVHLVRADARQEALLLLDVVDEALYFLGAYSERRVLCLRLVERVHRIVLAGGGLGGVFLDLVHAADLALVEVHVPLVRLHLRLEK